MCLYCQDPQRMGCASVQHHCSRCCQRTHLGRRMFWVMELGNTEGHAKSPLLKQYSTWEWNIRCPVKYFIPQKRRIEAEPPKLSTHSSLKRLRMSSNNQCCPLCTSQRLNSSGRVLLVFLKIFPCLSSCHFISKYVPQSNYILRYTSLDNICLYLVSLWQCSENIFLIKEWDNDDIFFYEEMIVDWFWDSSKPILVLQNTRYSVSMTKLKVSWLKMLPPA